MSDITGKTIRNRYRVDSFVGRGGMAEVYKVWDNERGVHLAMKVLREDLAEDKLFMRRFAREAQTLANLQHPNIVRFYGLEQDASLAFMLMDFVEGTTLRREIYNLSGPLEYERIMEVMRPACAALGYAHKRGVIHCDVKPGNIMLEQSGRVLIADFGIARLTDAATATMVGLGTPAYMAPELVRGKEPTPQSDVYSLGVILFEMLTGGERPFTGEQASITGSTSDKIRWEQATLDPPTPRKWHRELTEQQEAVILTALDKDLSKRQPSSDDLYGDLDTVFGRSMDPAPREKPEEADQDQRVRAPELDPESITGAVKTSDRTYRTKSKLWIAVIAATIVGIGFTMWFGNERGWWGDSINGGDMDIEAFVLEGTSTVVLKTPTADIFDMGITQTPPSTKLPAMTPITTPSLKIITSENASEMQLIATLSAPIAGVAWAPSGEQLVTIDAEGLKVRTVPSLRLVEGYRYEQRNLRCVAWSPDGYWIAGGTSDGLVLVWNVESGEMVWASESHDGKVVMDIGWSPDSAFVASGGFDNRVRVWDSETGGQIRELEFLTGQVNSVAWSPYGIMLAVGGGPHNVKVWDTTHWILQADFALKPDSKSVAWSPDGKELAIAGHGLYVWHTPSNSIQQIPRVEIWAVDISPDGSLLVTVEDSGILISEASSQEALRELNLDWHGDTGDLIAWSPKGDAVVRLTVDGDLFMFGVPESVISVTMPKLGVGSTQVSDVDGMVMVYVPEGTFQRFVWSGGHEAGGDDINLSGFWIDQTEVTNAMFAEFINTEGNQSEGGNTWLDAGDDDVRIEKKGGEWYASFGWEDHPVVEITWYGAAAYCEWAGRRLPTITEWEKASRGEGGNLYPWGNAELNCNLANYKVLGNYSECRGETSKVGSYPDGASPYGALDTAGNVWEWVADWWWDPHYYESSPTENPPGPSSGSLRMLQGGSWIWLPSRLLVWNTRTSIPADSYYDGGFRCASSP